MPLILASNRNNRPKCKNVFRTTTGIFQNSRHDKKLSIGQLQKLLDTLAQEVKGLQV